MFVQINVLQQLVNIASHDALKEAFDQGKLHIHGGFFFISHADEIQESRENLEDRKLYIILRTLVNDEISFACCVPSVQCCFKIKLGH